MLAAQIKDVYYKVPVTIRQFLVRALIVFICWQLLYHFVLHPTRIPDMWLTDLTANATAKFLGLFYHPVAAITTNYKALIMIGDRKIIRIADACNGLELFVLYIAFLFCFPASNKRRIPFLLGGVALIFVLNIFRCAALSWLSIHHRNWVDITHHYIFTSIMYLIIFYSWVLYSKKGLQYEA